MRVVHAIWSMGLGGAESLLVDIANRQARAASVTLVVANAAVDAMVLAGLDPAVAIHRVARPPGSRNPVHLYRLWRSLRGCRPDVIHAHAASLGPVLAGTGARTLLTVHDTGLPTRGVSAFDAVVAVSTAVQRDLAGRDPPVAARVVANGIDFAAIALRQPRPRSGALRAVQVSRLVAAKKGQDILLEALRRVLAARGADALVVDFIGDGPDRAALEARARELGVGAACRFIGALPRHELYRRLCDYDVLVQPSRYEGFGLTIVEAVAAGLPVLCADLEGPREIVATLPAAWRFAPGDPADCARQIGAVLDAYGQPGFAATLAANRAAALAAYGIDATVAAYASEYARLVGGSHG